MTFKRSRSLRIRKCWTVLHSLEIPYRTQWCLLSPISSALLPPLIAHLWSTAALPLILLLFICFPLFPLMYWWLIYLVWSSVIQIRLQRWAQRWHVQHLAAPLSPSATSGSQHCLLKWQTSVDPCFMKSFPLWNLEKYGILGVLLCTDIIKTHCEQKELYGSQPEMLPVNVPHSLCTDRKLTERKLQEQ